MNDVAEFARLAELAQSGMRLTGLESARLAALQRRFGAVPPPRPGSAEAEARRRAAMPPVTREALERAEAEAGAALELLAVQERQSSAVGRNWKRLPLGKAPAGFLGVAMLAGGNGGRLVNVVVRTRDMRLGILVRGRDGRPRFFPMSPVEAAAVADGRTVAPDMPDGRPRWGDGQAA